MKRTLILTLLALLSPLIAEATITRALSLEQLALEADVIVRGRVAARESAWNKDHTRIYTLSRVEVSEVLKGGKVEALRVRQIGGNVNGITQAIAGNAKLVEGEEVVLFLDADERPERPYHYILGMAQGKYSVLRRPDGEPLITRNLKGLALARLSGDGVARINRDHHPAPEPELTLSALRAQVQAALQR